MTGLVADQLIPVLAGAHVADGQVDALLLAPAAHLQCLVLETVVVVACRALVDATKISRLILKQLCKA